jgi:hypothetical protein
MVGEFIRHAAVKLNNDIFTGKNHSVCLSKMKSSTTQGFIADSYSGPRFVGRKEALEIAIEAGQNINKHNPKDKLVSEDLSEDKIFMEFNG